MPGGDGTGPAGMGPMTGRAAGYCAGYGAPGYMNPAGGRGFGGGGYGRGYGRGGGRGFGFRRFGWTGAPRAAAYPAPVYGPAYGGAYQAPTAEQELDALKAQAEYFEGAMADIRKRIDELESREK